MIGLRENRNRKPERIFPAFKRGIQAATRRLAFGRHDPGLQVLALQSLAGLKKYL
jgi:hypothetical protein